MRFDNQIDDDTREEINELAHFMNQNVIIRLYALLDYYDIYKGLNDELRGYDHLWILKKLRNIFAHTAGQYEPNKPKHLTIVEKMNDMYKLDADPNQRTKFPVLKRKVIGTMINGIERYIREFYKHKDLE